MRFVSDKRGLSITIKPGSPEVRDPGTYAVTRQSIPDVEAEFSHDLLDEEAIFVAKLAKSQGGLANIDRRADGSMPDSPFRGLGQDESGKFLPVETRLAVFDSEVAQLQNGWSDELREEVEQALLGHAYRGSLYQLVERQAAPASAPWSGYDSVTDPERVIEIASMTDSDLSVILAYEKSGQNRDYMVGALEREITSLGEAEVVVNA